MDELPTRRFEQDNHALMEEMADILREFTTFDHDDKLITFSPTAAAQKLIRLGYCESLRAKSQEDEQNKLLSPEETAVKEILEHYFVEQFDESASDDIAQEIVAKARLAKIQGKDSGIQSMYKEGITPLLTDASEVTGILPTGKKLKEVCPDKTDKS